MTGDILKKYKSDCYPIFATLGVDAHLNFKNTTYLHHFTSSADTEFYYFIKLFSRIPYFNESYKDKDIYFLALHLYTYDHLGLRVDVIKNGDFYDTLEDVIDIIYPISTYFTKHHKYVLSFSGEEKYSFDDFEKVLTSWKKQILKN